MPQLGSPTAPAVTSASSASLDDADALPAVGKVWDTGPKRSLSSIFAASKPRDQQKPAGTAQTAVVVSADLQAAWNALLAAVKEQFGPAAHVPLVSGEPRRDGDMVIVRFAGPFASMARLLEKHRDGIKDILCQITGQTLGLQFEADESAPPPKMAPQAPRAEAANAPSSVMVQAPKEGLPLTPELRDQLEKDPLIRALLEAFNGNIVKVEDNQER